MTLVQTTTTAREYHLLIPVPHDNDAEVLLNTLGERDQRVLAGGQEYLSGKIVRIAHMGCCEVRDLFTAMNCLQLRLQEFGFPTPTTMEGGASQW